MFSRLLTFMNNLPRYWQVFGIKGIISYAWIRYGAADKVRPQYLRGIMAPVYLRCNSTDPLTLREVFLDRDYEIETDTKVNFIVDAGANVGFAAIFFANKYPDAKILAIEPEENNFALLERNVMNYTGIVPIRAALWNHSGVIELSDPGRGAHGYVTGESTASSGMRTQLVQAVSLADLIKRFDIHTIDLLKVDIEGAEKEVFDASVAWIDKVSLIIAEVHEGFKPGCETALYTAAHDMQTVLKRGKLVVLKKSF